MAKHLTRDLDRLQQQLLGLAERVEEAADRATQAVFDRDAAAARAVIAADEVVDALENRVQEECLKLLALHQPVAGDLRRIASAFSITTDLERIGDLAVDIAERVLDLAAGPPVPVPDALRRLADVAIGMVRQALEAFVALDSRAAVQVIRTDDEADRLHAGVIDELIAGMKADPATVDARVSLFSVARHLERIGDHATNIAEDAVYLADGEIVRHRPEALRNSQ
ncbi:MAG: phosphate signaling complex protein PhoU [Gemmataceae bacterium]